MKTLLSHLDECFGFVPFDRVWAFMLSDAVEVIVIFAIVFFILSGVWFGVLERVEGNVCR
jgi:hypothetical protein